LRKQNILDLCEFYFFNGTEPKLFWFYQLQTEIEKLH
jgi:hypothetical protein